MKRKTKVSIEVKLYMLAGVVIILAAIMTWIGYGQDIEFHAERLAAIAEEMRHGPGIYRIYSSFCEGYGYAAPLFYGDIFLYPFAWLIAVGVPLAVSFRLFLATIMIACFGITYFCAKTVFTKQESIVLTYLYAFSPVLLEDIFIRYAVGEALGYIFLPVVILGFYRIAIAPRNVKRDWMILSLGMSGMLLSHIITTFLTTLLLVLLCLIYLKRIWKNKKAIVYMIYAALLTVGLTGFFVLPMLEQMFTAKFYVVNRQTSNLAANVAPIQSLFFGSEYMSVINFVIEKVTGIQDAIKFSWFPGAFGYLLLFVVLVIGKKKICTENKMFKFAFGMCLLYLAVSMVPWIQPILEPVIGFIKIAWRNLTFYMFFLAVAATILLAECKRKGWQRIYRIGLLCATFGTLICFGGLGMITIHNGMFPYEELSTTSIGLGEYLPSEVSNYDYSLERGETVWVSDSEVEYLFYRKEGDSYIEYSNGQGNEIVFEVPVYMYRGYAVEDEIRREAYNVTISSNGLVQFSIPNATEGILRIYYRGTLIQKISVLISTVSCLTIAFIFFREGKHDQHSYTNI